jgi:Protein of unknown function (DUF1186)
MEPEKILHELTYAHGLPRAALKAASAQRVEMLPLFLDEIEAYLALEPATRAKPTPLFFIFHLLGEWREKAAYRPLARLLRLPRRDVDAIFGDGITTTSHRVMAAVFDGDPEPLYNIILDPNAEEFIRAGICEALAMVTLRGELDRAAAGRFLRDSFIEMRPQAECYVWVGWQSAIAMLGMSDLKVLVKKAFDRGSLTTTFSDLTISRRILDAESTIQVRHGFRTIATARYSAIPSKSYPDGTAFPSNTARTKNGIGERQRLIAPAANALRIRSRALGETIRALAAVGRNSRNAALLRCGLG